LEEQETDMIHAVDGFALLIDHAVLFDHFI